MNPGTATIIRSVGTTAVSESDFTRQVIALAELFGWLAFHPIPLRTAKGWVTGTQGTAGFPDLTLAKRGRVILAELKVGRNKPTPAQTRWIEASGAYLWTPNDWPEIERVLTAPL